MSDETKHTGLVLAAILMSMLIVAAMIVGIVREVEQTNREMVRQGYHQEPTMMPNGTHWAKGNQ